MPPRNIVIDTITKIEGNAGLKVLIEDEEVKNLQFIISDYRRFFTTAVRGKRIVAVPSFLSRICGTCSVAHLFASLMAIESSQGIAVTEQTKALRRLAYDGLMIRDHGLHLYFFVLPDVLGVDSILDVSDDPGDIGYTLLHDSFDIKRLGTDISNATVGAAIHAPWPTVGGFLRNPEPAKFPDLLARLEAIRPKVLRGIDAFFGWDASLVRNTDYLGLRNDTRFDFLEGDIVNSNGRRISTQEFKDYLQYVQIPHSHAEGYRFSDTEEDYLVGALARINLNRGSTSSKDEGRRGKLPFGLPFEQRVSQQLGASHRGPTLRRRRDRSPEDHPGGRRGAHSDPGPVRHRRGRHRGAAGASVPHGEGRRGGRRRGL